jgi:hypothetical protein
MSASPFGEGVVRHDGLAHVVRGFTRPEDAEDGLVADELSGGCARQLVDHV